MISGIRYQKILLWLESITPQRGDISLENKNNPNIKHPEWVPQTKGVPVNGRLKKVKE